MKKSSKVKEHACFNNGNNFIPVKWNFIEHFVENLLTLLCCFVNRDENMKITTSTKLLDLSMCANTARCLIEYFCKV